MHAVLIYINTITKAIKLRPVGMGIRNYISRAQMISL